MKELPKELIISIINFCIFPNIYNTSLEITSNARDNMMMYLIFKYNEFDAIVKKNKVVHRLIKKYYIYQSDYDLPLLNYRRLREPYELSCYTKLSSPILLDLCFTGCYLPYARHSANPTKEYFESELFQDIQTIIEYIPGAVHCTWGIMRCRTEVTPLYAAITNTNIPISIVKYLLDNGAHSNKYICVNNEKCHVLEDYYFCNLLENDGENKKHLEQRYLRLKELFDKY